MPLLASRRQSQPQPFAFPSASQPQTPSSEIEQLSIDQSMTEEDIHSKADKFVRVVLQKAINGISVGGYEPISSAAGLASQYINDTKYSTIEERVKALVKKEGMKALSIGFGTNMGGSLVSLVAGLPTSLVLGFALEARLIAAIALIHGHDITTEPVQTLVLLSLLGSEKLIQHVLKRAATDVAQRVTARVVLRSGGRTLITIQRLVGVALMTRLIPKNEVAKELTTVSLGGAVPFFGSVVGGCVGGAFEWASLRAHAKLAVRMFREEPSVGTVESVEAIESEIEIVELSDTSSVESRRQSIQAVC